MFRPELDFETDDEELTPGQMHDRWEGATNLQADALRDVRGSERNERYLEQAEGNETEDPPIAGGPLSDALHLATTPRSEWGGEEKAEAEEALNFARRTFPQFEQTEGEGLIESESPKIHKDEMSLIRWGFDPKPGDEFP